MHASWVNPIALFALLPWAAVFPLLRRGSDRPAHAISFLPLWQAATPVQSLSRRRRLPPRPVILLWAAAGLGIVAAGGPQITRQHPRADRARPVAAWISLAARADPFPQVMVEVRNESDATSIPLRLKTAGQSIEQALPLGPRGTITRRFITLPALGPTVQASIAGVSLVAQPDRGWPALATAGILPEPVRRFVSVYTARRPARAGTDPVVVCPAGIEENGPAVEIVNGIGSPPSAPLWVSPGPVTADVSTWAGPADSTARPPANFAPQVRRGNATLVATAVSPTRQVWLNVDESAWGDTDDNVILLANAVQWAGQAGDPIYRATPPPPAAPEPATAERISASGLLCVTALLLAAAASCWARPNSRP